MLGKLVPVCLVLLFACSCKKVDMSRNDDTDGKGDANKEGSADNEGDTNKKGDASADISFALTSLDKKVRELFEIVVVVKNIRLQNIEDFKFRLGYSVELNVDEDLQIKLTAVSGNENILGGNNDDKFVRDGVAKFTDLYLKKPCAGNCQLVAELGSYGNRGCADDCDYPFVPVEPATEASIPFTSTASVWQLQAKKDANNTISITIANGGVPVANTQAQVVVCNPKVTPTRCSFLDLCDRDAPDFIPSCFGMEWMWDDREGTGVLEEQTVTLDNNGSWSGGVAGGDICASKIYVEIAGQALTTASLAGC